MEVTRDVVKDLLPLYISGEVSIDTKTLVEAYLRLDPDLARAVAAARSLELPSTPSPAPTSEKATLDETRRLLKQRSDTLVTAIIFTVLPFLFTFDSTGINFFLIRDKPVVGAAWLFTAAVLWAWHVYLRRRLAVTGL
jgi:hypothetical protein